MEQGAIFNIYCDESCHLENDHLPVMVLGSVWCPLENTYSIATNIRAIKVRHGLPKNFEIKWSKVSAGKVSFYLDIIDSFFEEPEIHFRGILIPDKNLLQHDPPGRSHDTWYYKMYFEMLKVLINPEASYRIYLDIKDTRGAIKVKELQEMLSSHIRDYEREVLCQVQTVRSHEIEQMQLTDLLIGALGYKNRHLTTNRGKVAVVERLRERSGYSLSHTTLFREEKLNLLVWKSTLK